MVEQVRISPTEVRGYGNVCEDHTLDDFIVSSSGLAKEKEDVHGALTSVYRLVYSVYGLMFYFDKGNKQLYLQTNEANTLSLGFDTANKQLYLVDEDDTGFSLDFDEDTNELYITDDAPPIVHNYSLALDQSSYTTTGSLSVSATLLDDGVAVSGATVSFTGGVSTVTATTNSSGVATATVNFTSSGTLTASYSNVSDTASVTVSHNYSLAFSSSSYVATGGSAEVSVTLLDDNVAVTGATISFTGGTSTVTGVTNSSGVATATVSVSATSTITATYQNVTDTCIVTVGSSVSSVLLTGTSNILSYYHNETCTLSATILDSNNQGVSGETVTFYKGTTSIGTATTNASGVATKTYSSSGAGDVSFTAECSNITSSAYSVEDCFLYSTSEISRTSTHNTDTLISIFNDFSFTSNSYVVEADVKFGSASVGFGTAPTGITTLYHHITFANSYQTGNKLSFYTGKQSSGETTYRYDYINLDTYYNLKYEFSNSSVTPYVDGVQKGTYSNLSYLNGETRYLCWQEWDPGKTITAKNIKIKPL